MKITITPTLRRYLDGMGVKRLPRGLKWAEVEIERIHAATQHPEENAEEHMARAIARVAHRMGSQDVTRSLKRFVSDRRVLWVMIAVLLLLLLDSQFGHSQETRVRGAVKGSTTSAPVTATSTDANHTGLDVNCVSGCSASAGASSVTVNDPSVTTQKLAVDAGGKIGVNNHPAFLFDGSGNLKAALQNASIAVTGTFWQSIQPVSGTVSVGNFPASQAVTGTFWQATQPVSGSVSVSNFPASQTVVGGLADAASTSGASGLLIMGDSPTQTGKHIQVDANGNQIVVQPTAANLNATVTGTVTANQGGSPWANNVSQFGGSNVVTGTGTGGAGIPRVTVSSDSSHPVTVAPSTDTAAGGLTATSKATVTSSVSVKASAGLLYGVFIMNGAIATCWLELINSASAGTLGTAVIMNIPMASAGLQYLQFNPPIGGFTSGIAVGSASAVGGSSACGTAVTGVTVIYK